MHSRKVNFITFLLPIMQTYAYKEFIAWPEEVFDLPVVELAEWNTLIHHTKAVLFCTEKPTYLFQH